VKEDQFWLAEKGGDSQGHLGGDRVRDLGMSPLPNSRTLFTISRPRCPWPRDRVVDDGSGQSERHRIRY
jgi:hypothetical protein